MAITVTPVQDAFVAKIDGVDLRADHSPAVLGAIEEALDRYAVVILPGQHLSDDEQIEVSKGFGDLSYALSHGRAVGQNTRLRPELYDISNLDEKHGILGEADRRRQWREADKLWHTDRSFIDADTTYSFLSGRIVPPTGGNTDFADMRRAYDDLPEAMKTRIADLQAVHSIWHSRALAGGVDFRADEIATMPPVVQPLVRVHPRTGRRSMVLASHASEIVGIGPEEGRALLAELTAFALQPRYLHSHVWRQGDLVIWDNRCTMHRGTPFDDKTYRRDMRRTTVQGRSRYARAAA
jgi:alpha-ketoglutarate-dependent 2,4-dichlorophenoxyacetate dioxygenase